MYVALTYTRAMLEGGEGARVGGSQRADCIIGVFTALLFVLVAGLGVAVMVL